MSDVNLFELDLIPPEDEDPEGYRSSYRRVGPLLAAVRLGATVVELPPGQSICPYHYEYGNEEWLIVLEGSATLRTPAGDHEVTAGDAVCFPEGPEGAHKVTNRGVARVLVAMLSTKHDPSVAVYPDSNKLGVWSGNDADKAMVRRGENLAYYDGEL